jgi:hypothetical protein
MNTYRPCPVCGGKDRFAFIQSPRNGGRPFWWCRQCNHTEAAVEADIAEVTPETKRLHSPVEVHGIYRAYAEIAQRCATALWAPDGRSALTYLRQRGLEDATIQAMNLGWCGDGYALLRQLWYEEYRAGVLKLAEPYSISSVIDMATLGGLRKPNWQPQPILYGGVITIPYMAGGKCVLLRSRRLNPEVGQAKYLSPSGPLYAGGQPQFYLHDSLRGASSVILTEGEFKALAAHQEWRAGRLSLPTIATPGIGYLSPDLIAALRGKTVYLAYDAEAPRFGDAHSPGDLWVRRNGAKLTRTGIKVKVILLPRPDHLNKVDLDSYILANKSR